MYIFSVSKKSYYTCVLNSGNLHFLQYHKWENIYILSDMLFIDLDIHFGWVWNRPNDSIHECVFTADLPLSSSTAIILSIKCSKTILYLCKSSKGMNDCTNSDHNYSSSEMAYSFSTLIYYIQSSVYFRSCPQTHSFYCLSKMKHWSHQLGTFYFHILIINQF